MMEITQNWRVRGQRLRLEGEVCEEGHFVFPPRDVCPQCLGIAAQVYAFSGRGEVYSYTTVYEAPEGYEYLAPYTVALIRLEEGPLVTAMLTDVDNGDVRIGLPVEMVTRKLREDGAKGQIIYGYKFRPVL